jgi:hypothetical protein
VFLFLDTVMIRRIGTAALTVLILPCAMGQTERRSCVVEHERGQDGDTVVVMSLVNDGQSCVLQKQVGKKPATSLSLREAPAHGTLASTDTSVAYTPNPGFVGKDAFDVQWFGSGFGPAKPNRNVRTRVEVTVRAKGDEP